ncbi:hypothetical protein [Paraburkholderia sacchari]|uniref:Uncharacterized protein n=1 Tax=Paraburkholderia sacchari TaxID=159450 RepID=A0A8T6Z6D7_9BURK|nr:hypothetical protein [Paraburkholderia sacchari]NLP60281.1 hypothetical protein [Paraburkholderia sacchari]
MRAHDEAMLELVHIRTMVLRLEHIIEHENIGHHTTAVMSPDYWRARVKAIACGAPLLQPQAGTLLARLDAIDAALSNRCPGKDRPGLGT